MRLQINGQQADVPDGLSSVADLLEHFGLGDKVLIVELDGIIVEQTAHANTRLADGNRIEIVHFVGGG